MTTYRRLAALLLSLTCLPVFASNVVTLDFRGRSIDVVYGIDMNGAGRLYLQGSADSGTTTGIFGVDLANPLSDIFGAQGKFLQGPVSFVVRPDGTLLSLEREPSNFYLSRVIARDRAGNPTMSSVEIADLSVSLAVQPDGKMLVGGEVPGSHLGGPSMASRITRLNADGTLDQTFSGGAVQLQLGWQMPIGQMVTLPNGKIAATAGTATLILLNSDGTLDSSFGINGTVSFGNSGTIAIAADSTGRIYVVAGTNSVKRVLQDGSVDLSFNAAALQATSLGGVAIDSMQRVVVFGQIRTSSSGYLARLTTAGALDNSFGGTGEISVTLPQPLPAGAENMCFGTLQTDDKPMLACRIQGEAGPSDVFTDAAVARYNVDGTPDATLGTTIPNFDYYPDAFSFQSGTAAYGTASVMSSPVTITGINVKTPVSAYGNPVAPFPPLAGGNISAGCTGVFTLIAMIGPGDTFCVRNSASAQPQAATTLTVTVGGRDADFTINSTNVPATTKPAQFTLTDQTDVELSALVLSNPVTVTGITGFAAVSVSGDNGFARFSIGCDPATSGNTTGYITNGQTICLAQIAASSPGAAETATLTIGGVSASFTVTTKAAAAPPPPPPPPPPTGTGSSSGATNSSGGGGGSFDELSLAAFACIALFCTVRRRRTVHDQAHHR